MQGSYRAGSCQVKNSLLFPNNSTMKNMVEEVFPIPYLNL